MKKKQSLTDLFGLPAEPEEEVQLTETEPANGNGVCLVPSCVREVNTRGLCHGHYQTASKLVKAGQTTWQKLEAGGKALPAQRQESAVDFFLGE